MEAGLTRQIHQKSRRHFLVPKQDIGAGGGRARTALSSFGHNEGAEGMAGRHDGGELQSSDQPASQAALAHSGRGVSIDFPIASGPQAANPGPGC